MYIEANYYKICSNLHKLYEELHEVHQNLLNYQKLQNSHQKNPKPQIFNIGDTVLMTKNNAFRKGSSGSHVVTDKINDLILKIKFANDYHAPAFNVQMNEQVMYF